MKALLVLVLVLAFLLILLSGPMVIGGMAWCPACLALSVCLAVLAAEILIMSAVMVRRSVTFASLSVQPIPGFGPFRPPRPA